MRVRKSKKDIIENNIDWLIEAARLCRRVWATYLLLHLVKSQCWRGRYYRLLVQQEQELRSLEKPLHQILLHLCLEYPGRKVTKHETTFKKN